MSQSLIVARLRRPYMTKVNLLKKESVEKTINSIELPMAAAFIFGLMLLIVIPVFGL